MKRSVGTKIYIAIELLIGGFCAYAVIMGIILLISDPSWFVLIFALYIPGTLLVHKALRDWQQGNEQVWLKRHLNWTYLIGLCFGGGLLETESVIGMWIGVLILIPTTIWILKQKGRSLWTILWGFLGILPIIILCMKNKRKELENATPSIPT